MNNPITYHNSLLSQYRQMEESPNPVRAEVEKCLGTYDFTATFEKDAGTTEILKIPGLIAFTCKIKRGNKVIGIGWGSSAINQNSRFVERTVRSAFNSSIVDAIIRSTKILDSFHPVAISQTQDIVAQITDKQRSYLIELIQANITDRDEIRHWEKRIQDGLTKNEASEAIQKFKR